MRAGAAALVLAGFFGAACGWAPFGGLGQGPAAQPATPIELVDEGAVVDFYERASSFYGRLARRRFDSIETYQDEALRGFFRTQEAYADYYADLTSALVDAHFEKNRPISLEVVEMSLEGPGRARVHTRIVGDDGRPLRPGKVEIERVDRWERSEGAWRIDPGRT